MIVHLPNLGDVVSDQNAFTAARQLEINRQAEELVAALRAEGVTPIVEEQCSPASAAGYIGFCTYAVKIEESPEYVGRMVTGQGDTEAMARQIASDAQMAQSYYTSPQYQKALAEYEDAPIQRPTYQPPAPPPVMIQTAQLTPATVLQQLLPTGDVSAWVSQNKWLLIGGAAAVAFFMMGRGK